MKVCIAEKPSVARDIARILGANERKDGYLSGNGYAVTWGFGHLVGLAMPEAYGIQGFRRENLPIFPEKFTPCGDKFLKFFYSSSSSSSRA